MRGFRSAEILGLRTMRRSRVALVAMAVGVAAVAAGVAGAGAPAGRSAPSVHADARVAVVAHAVKTREPDLAAPATGTARGEDAPSAKPASLEGTDPDGALRVDADGDLIVEPAVLRFFDYFLSATGEESQATIHARIVAAIRERVHGGAEARALGLLESYLGYREAARGIRAANDAGGRLAELRRQRRAHFSHADADALFGSQEAVDAVAVEKQRIGNDASLSAAERARRLTELDGELPAAERAARAASMRPHLQREDEEAMRAKGATDEEIQRRRVETVGEAAALRLQALDRARADWAGRLQRFQEARDAIARDVPDPDARASAIAHLVEDSFSPRERLRVHATALVR